MLREGPIPRLVFGILEYLLGIAFIAAPFVFDFDSGVATGLAVAMGVLILILAAVSDGPTSLVNQLPTPVAVTLDYLVAIFLIAAPFLLGFAGDAAARNFFLIAGVVFLLLTIGTRFKPREDNGAARRGADPERTGGATPAADFSAPASNLSGPAPSSSGPAPDTSGPAPSDPPATLSEDAVPAPLPPAMPAQMPVAPPGDQPPSAPPGAPPGATPRNPPVG